MNTQTRIDALKAAHAAELSSKVAEIERDEAARARCPMIDGAPVKRTTAQAYDRTTRIDYEVTDAAEALRIMQAWRDKYGEFLPVGEYVKGCAVVTAHPGKEYTPDTMTHSAPDAVVARNNKGKGFDSLSFEFFPNVPGERVGVSVDMAFRCSMVGFHGRIDANYSRSGDVTTVQKTRPPAFNSAAYVVAFNGGARDTADWHGVFTFAGLTRVVQP